MAGNMSNYLENKVLEHTLGKTAFALPTVSVALFSTNPTDANTGTEVTGGGYSRKPVVFGTAVGGSISNSEDVLFDVATDIWGTVTHVGIVDETGNLLWHGELTASKIVNTGDQFKIAASSLTITID